MNTVFRIQKFKRDDVNKVLREAQRTPEMHYKKGIDFDNDIDWTRTHLNQNIRNGKLSDITKIMKAQGVKARNSESVLMIGSIITASPEYFTRDENGNYIYDEKLEAFGKDAARFIVNELCGGDSSRLVSFQLHLDEKSPHFHAYTIPIVEENGERKLSAKALFNGRQRMRELQDKVFEYIGKPRNFERGELLDLTKSSKSQKRHKSTHEYRAEEYQKAIDEIIETSKGIDKDIDIQYKDATFGKGKIITNEQYEELVKTLESLSTLNKSIDILKELKEQADKNGRVKTLENRLLKGNHMYSDLKSQYDELVKQAKEFEALKNMMKEVKINNQYSLDDIWRDAKARADYNYNKTTSKFKEVLVDVKRGVSIEHSFEMSTQTKEDYENIIRDSR